jgi:hypothetical protein
MFKTDLPSNYRPCNPSIIKLADGFGLALRTVNYSINPDGSYNYPGYVHTRTLYCELSTALQRLSVIELDNPIGNQTHIRGIEDVRLYDKAYSTIYGLGTRLDGQVNEPTIHSCQWSAKTGRLLDCTPISRGVEKNWLPFITYEHGWPDILYSTQPLRIIGLDGQIKTQVELPFNNADFRGGASPIPYLNGWLWVIHHWVVLADQIKRKYLHRFCWINKSLAPDSFRLSSLFNFQKSQIEFCAGLCKHEDSIILTYGVEDNEAYMAIVKDELVMKMLGV